MGCNYLCMALIPVFGTTLLIYNNAIFTLNYTQSRTDTNRSDITWSGIQLSNDTHSTYVLQITRDTLYPALAGELWGVYCEYFPESLPCIDGIALYHNHTVHDGHCARRNPSFNPMRGICKVSQNTQILLKVKGTTITWSLLCSFTTCIFLYTAVLCAIACHTKTHYNETWLY